ncbi:hypothetical protein LEN26_000580 [Aphanomyces euteiches]|nr:hypothetical protein AeMF1_003509 [Aphanomyces euteiches]KAH9163271.1 hypothetical protein LEN26_000580 [Aphanomyces euteiches]KAH9190293.1 hypothetical protein AeNC1_007724 [Aphanomyces euteiches]
MLWVADVARSLSESLDRLKDLSAEVSAMTAVMQALLDTIEAKKRQWRQLKERVEKNAGELIVLNVGGTLFKTSRETLLRMEGTYFHAMLGSRCWMPDNPPNIYFIDTDPTHFDRILAFLRSGDLSFEGLNSWECCQLRVTLDYLNIVFPPFEKSNTTPLSWNPSLCSSVLRLVDANQTVEKPMGTPSLTGSNSVMADAPATTFAIRLDEFPSSPNALAKLFVGLAPKHGFGVQAYNPETGGFYLELRWGNLHDPSHKGERFCSGFVAGDVVSVSRNASGISFKKNGHDLGISIRSVMPSSIDLFPVVVFHYMSAKVTLL